MEEQTALRYPAGKREWVFFGGMAVWNVFLWNCILYGGFNLGFAIGAIGTAGWSVWYLLSCGYRPDGYCRGLLTLAALIAAGFGRSGDSFVKFVLFLFFLLAVNLSLCIMAGQNRRSAGSISSLLDGPRALFRLGLGSMGPVARGLNEARKQAGSAGRKGSAAVLGLVITVPVVAVLVALLMRADAAFEGLMGLLPKSDWREPAWSLLFGLLWAWVLYARGLGLRHGEKASAGVRTRFLNAITVNILLCAVCAVYGVYLISQLAYFSGGVCGILPEDYTLAEYARRGFFEMAWLSAINLGLMCFAMGLVEKEAGTPMLTRVLCLMLGLISLFLIGTASAKMLLYIGSFGLTRLRVLTQVIMVWLAVTTVLVCIWLFRPRFPYMKGVVLAALAIGTAVLWIDVDTQVAKYNVRAYQEGRLERVDVYYLGQLEFGAVPYLEELTRDPDPQVAEQAEYALSCFWYDLDDFRDWNYSKARAGEILVNYLPGLQEQAEALPADQDIILRGDIGVSLAGAQVTVVQDHYGGFHGDGSQLLVFPFPPAQEHNDVMAKTAGDGGLWHPLPLTDTLALALYGSDSRSAFFTDDAGAPLVPPVENGWYFFQNRHPNAADPGDDSALYSRVSYNFTLAVYDADARTLYYMDYDS